MDFLKCSQVYGYKSIAEVDMLADGDSVEKVARITKLSEDTVRELQAEVLDSK